MSVRSAGGGGGKNVDLKISAFSSFDAAVPLIVGMYDDVGVESMYFLSFQIVFSSASFTNFLHIVLFVFLIFPLYFLSLSFHALLCSSFLVFLNLFLALFVSLRAFVNSSVHHLLLNGHIFLRGV